MVELRIGISFYSKVKKLQKELLRMNIVTEAILDGSDFYLKVAEENLSEVLKAARDNNIVVYK